MSTTTELPRRTVPAGIDPPSALYARPRDRRGYIVPWFVAYVDGEPDFRVVRPNGIALAVRQQLCWLCGARLGRDVAYVVGPMCAVNRTSAEPPSHLECARYAAQACPFLANPERHRQEAKPMPDGAGEKNVPGFMIRRNPGVALVWQTRRPLRTFTDPRGGLLFNIGTPRLTEWYAHGRPATREEVEASIESGVPLLRAHCYGPRDRAELAAQVAVARRFLPA